MRRLLVAAAAVVGVGLIAVPTVARESSTTIVSTSGVPHHDVGNLTKSRSWRPGMPEGINGPWREAIDIAIGQIASENPDAVLHTGDMVAGRWGQDVDGTGIFGPVNTEAQRRRAVRRAASLYYRQNKSWWAAHGLDPHFGVGDHEMGDVPPSGVVDRDTFQYRALSTWRNAWARAFTDDGTRYAARPPRGQHRKTAYATMIGDIGFVSLDPITKGPDGVRARLGDTQMRWLDGVLRDLRDQGARWLIVQSEAPARGPNRQSHSSRTLLQDGERLWRVLADHDVDLLLTAEFHEMTTNSDQGTTPVQIVHGGQLYRGNVNYLVIKASNKRLELQLKQMSGRQTGSGKIAAPAHLRANDGVRIYRGARVVGTMTIRRDGDLSNRTGYLTEGLECTRPAVSTKRCAAVRHAEASRAAAEAASNRPPPAAAAPTDATAGEPAADPFTPSPDTAAPSEPAAVTATPSPGGSAMAAPRSDTATSSKPMPDAASDRCAAPWSSTWPSGRCPVR